MLINGTVNIIMVGGVVPYGIDNSAVITLQAGIAMRPVPIIKASGQQSAGGKMSMNLKPIVIHSAEASINAP